MNAAMIEHFDPVAMTLPEIEAMQATLAELAARHRAEEDGPPEGDMETAFAIVRDGDWKEFGELEGIVEKEDEELEEYDPDENDRQCLEGE